MAGVFYCAQFIRLVSGLTTVYFDLQYLNLVFVGYFHS